MKKILILLICICSLLTSCSKKNTFGQENNILDWLCKTDDYVSDKMLEKILEAIESNNQSALMSLFSKNAIEDCQDLTAQINCLFEYCSETIVSYNNFGGTMAEELFEGNGNRKKTLYPTYDIKTSNDDYRLTFKFVTTDTNDINNKGIWSLYIIKSKNDANLDVAYRGDNEYTIGIHINISNIIEED